MTGGVFGGMPGWEHDLTFDEAIREIERTGQREQPFPIIEVTKRPVIDAVSNRLSAKQFTLLYMDGSLEVIDAYTLWMAWFIGKMHARTKGTYLLNIIEA